MLCSCIHRAECPWSAQFQTCTHAHGRPCRTLEMEWIIGGFEGGGTSEFCKVDEEEWELVRE